MARTVRTGGNELAALTGESRYLHGRSVATALFNSDVHSFPLDTDRAALLGLSSSQFDLYEDTSVQVNNASLDGKTPSGVIRWFPHTLRTTSFRSSVWRQSRSLNSWLL